MVVVVVVFKLILVVEMFVAKPTIRVLRALIPVLLQATPSRKVFIIAIETYMMA
jgi:hypothetical protein